MTRFACAIYTRKSSEEGLEKEFNSLYAQREACEAYVTSQKHAGWIAVRDFYDDGGLSGGTMERPALKRLLADIKSGKLQIVVIYKVDQLTRSLADFAKIVDVLDAHGASLVSVTQQFNTTTSMGRLTLNMLLSFAQFEREIAGERIRDKIAASKAKGMWMGGNVPLGYDARDRKLIINETEAKTVRMIFRRYAELGSVTLLQEELDRQGVRSKQREGAGGRLAGGRPFSRGILYLILQNHLYHGEVEHKGNVYPVSTRPLSMLSYGVSPRRGWPPTQGARTDHRGQGFKPAVRPHLRWRRQSHGADARQQARAPVPVLHFGIGARSWKAGSGHDARAGQRGGRPRARSSPDSVGVAECGGQCPSSAGTRCARAPWRAGTRWIGIPPEEMNGLSRSVVTRVTLLADRIDITIGVNRLAHALGASIASGHDAGPTIDLSVAAELRRSGQGKRMVIGDPYLAASDTSLVDVLKAAIAAREKLLADTDETLNEITVRTTKSKGRLTALTRVSYLAPDISADILAGRQPPELSVKRLLRTSQDLPLDWPGSAPFWVSPDQNRPHGSRRVPNPPAPIDAT